MARTRSRRQGAPLVEYAYVRGVTMTEVAPDEADFRVPSGLWNRYLAVSAKAAAVAAEVRSRSEEPLVAEPNQIDSLRAAVRPGTWIVVRESEPVEPAAPTHPVAPALVTSEVPPAQAPPTTPQRPALGRCAERSNLPHAPARYAITEAQSVYFPGHVRIDGICDCGLRIADVKCPHQKQVLKGDRPACLWCGHILVSRAGNIDNRRADGSADPNIPTLIPIGAAGDSPEVKQAFRAAE